MDFGLFGRIDWYWRPFDLVLGWIVLHWNLISGEWEKSNKTTIKALEYNAALSKLTLLFTFLGFLLFALEFVA